MLGNFALRIEPSAALKASLPLVFLLLISGQNDDHGSTGQHEGDQDWNHCMFKTSLSDQFWSVIFPS